MKKNVYKYMNNDLLASEEGAIEEKIMREGFDYMERRAAWKGIVADTFAEIDKEEVQKTQTRRFWQYAAAAIVLLLVAFGVWAMQPNKKTERKPYIQQGNSLDKSELVADASTYRKRLTNSIDDSQPPNVRKDPSEAIPWQSDFLSKEYKDAIQKLEALGKKRTLEETYYLALAYLKLNPKNIDKAQLDKAQPLLKAVAQTHNLYTSEALWYYALICLMNKQMDEAKMALDTVKIISPAHSEAAKELRKEL